MCIVRRPYVKMCAALAFCNTGHEKTTTIAHLCLKMGAALAFWNAGRETTTTVAHICSKMGATLAFWNPDERHARILEPRSP